MNKTFKKTVLAAGVALALSAGPALAANGINFDPTGTGGAGVPVDQFNWSNNVVLAQGVFNSSDGSTLTQGYLYGFGSLTTMSFGGSTVAGVTTDYSYEFRVPVAASFATVEITIGGVTFFGTDKKHLLFKNATSTGSCADSYCADENYFRIYRDTTPNFNISAGTGFGTSQGEVNADGGQNLILSGKITLSTSLAGDPLSGFSVGSTTAYSLLGGNSLITTLSGSGSLRMDVNVCSALEKTLLGLAPLFDCKASNISVNDEVNGAGDRYLTSYFRSDVDSIQVDMNTGQGLQDPFPPIAGGPLPPAGSGTGTVPSLVVNQTPDYDDQNDYKCLASVPCDMIYAGQNASSQFLHTVVPEPGSLALLGLGLGALGAFVRRRRKG